MKFQQTSRWAAARLCLRLFLTWTPVHLEWSALLAAMTAMSCKAHSPQSVHFQASGPPHHQPAQVYTFYYLWCLICTLKCSGAATVWNQISFVNMWLLTFKFFPPSAVRCPSLEALENGHINCSDSEQANNTQCSFTCSQDFSLHGHEVLTCDRHGNWTGEKPTCQGKTNRNKIKC